MNRFPAGIQFHNFEKKKIIPLRNEHQESHKKTKICYICETMFKRKYTEDKNYCNYKDHSNYTGKYRDASHSICNLKYNIPNEIPVVFHNESNYDYHFSIKVLANQFESE